MQGFNPHEARIKTPNPYLTMMGLYLGGFTGMFSETSLNIALPQLTEAFGVDVAVMQWMVVGYMLVIGIVLLRRGIWVRNIVTGREIVSKAAEN